MVRLLSRVRLFATPWMAAHQASLSFTISQSLLKLMSIKSVMPSNHLILCHPLQLLPLVLPSIRVFSNESVLPIRWTKYWSFSFSTSPSNENSGLISLKIDCKVSVPRHLCYSQTVTSIHDYWKNHSFDYADLCWQSDVSAF